VKEKDFSSFPFSGDKVGDGTIAAELLLPGVKISFRLFDKLPHAKANANKIETANDDVLNLLIVCRKHDYH